MWFQNVSNWGGLWILLYCISIGNKYIFTKAHSDNLFSINNLYKNGYELKDEYENERGRMSAFLKKL